MSEIKNEEYYRFLDRLRESGATNMFGAAPYLQVSYPELSKEEATKVLVNWMDAFDG